MPASEARRARRSRSQSVQPTRIPLTAREHAFNPEYLPRDDLVDMIAYKTALTIKRLALNGVALDEDLTIRIGKHPSFEDSITIEARGVRRLEPDGQ